MLIPKYVQKEKIIARNFRAAKFLLTHIDSEALEFTKAPSRVGIIVINEKIDVKSMSTDRKKAKGAGPPTKPQQYGRREEHYCTIPSCGDGEYCTGGRRGGFGSDEDD